MGHHQRTPSPQQQLPGRGRAGLRSSRISPTVVTLTDIVEDDQSTASATTGPRPHQGGMR
jgi:hypothetical protein